MLQMLVEGAHAESVPAVVLTFAPHPAEILGNQVDFKWLSPPAERNRLITGQGVDHIVLQVFVRKFASTEAETFVESLVHQLGLRRLLVGYDFALGKDRQGNSQFLSDLGRRSGYTLQKVEPVIDQDGIISSTRLRKNIRDGNLEAAFQGLNRYYPVYGKVVHGDGRGRTIHIPTINLEIGADKLVPVNGVYACNVWVSDRCYRAVTNIGTRPTFKTGDQSNHVEAHILDFQQEIYGQEVRLDFVKRLRDEQRFLSTESLIEQIHIDIEQAKKILE
jgi:riboflavin kinase/FMN adenylyltransferase